MQEIHIRMNLFLNPPPKKILDSPVCLFIKHLGCPSIYSPGNCAKYLILNGNSNVIKIPRLKRHEIKL